MSRIKKKNIMDIFSIYNQIFRDIHQISKIYLLLKVIHIIIAAAFPLTVVIFPQLIIDSVMGEEYVHACIIVIILFTINVIYSIIDQTLTLFFELNNQRLTKHYEKMLMNKMMNIEYKLVELASTHELKTEARRGSGYILRFMNNAQVFATNFITLVFVVYIVAYLNPLIIFLIFAVVAFNGFMNYKKNKVDLDVEKGFAVLYRKWDYLNYICRNLENAKEIRLHHLSKWLAKRISFFCEDNEALIRSSFHNKSVARRYAAISNMIQKGVVYFYVGLQLWNKQITAGEFSQYIAAFEMTSSTLVSIITSYQDINRDKHLIQKYYEFIQLKDDHHNDAISLIHDNNIPCSIEIKDVWFRYDESSEYVLKGLSLVIPAGECLSIVGRNGCGKTTLVKLLLRLLKPEKGQILLNGKNIYEYKPDEYCKLFSVIFQDFKIFSFSVKDNILMSDMAVDDEKFEITEEEEKRVSVAIEKAGLSTILSGLPQGVNTYINTNYIAEGKGLSGGEQQILAMSRAYYRNAGNIFLDEPTAMLDPLKESHIYENFNKLIGKKTAVYISHRMSCSRFCDKIAYIEDGVVKEYGTHEELMELNMLYANMFQTQASLYVEAAG